MKQQVEQEKLRRRAKPFTVSVPFTRQSAVLESSHFPECHIKVCMLLVYDLFDIVLIPHVSHLILQLDLFCFI